MHFPLYVYSLSSDLNVYPQVSQIPANAPVQPGKVAGDDRWIGVVPGG